MKKDGIITLSILGFIIGVVILLNLVISGVRFFATGSFNGAQSEDRRHKAIEKQLNRKYHDKFEVTTVEVIDSGTAIPYKFIKGEAKNVDNEVTFEYQINYKCDDELCDNYIGKLNETDIYEDVMALMSEYGLLEYGSEFELRLHYSFDANSLSAYKNEGEIEIRFDKDVSNKLEADEYYKLFNLLKDNGYSVDAKLTGPNGEYTYLGADPSEPTEETLLAENRYRIRMEDIGIDW